MIGDPLLGPLRRTRRGDLPTVSAQKEQDIPPKQPRVFPHAGIVSGNATILLLELGKTREGRHLGKRKKQGESLTPGPQGGGTPHSKKRSGGWDIGKKPLRKPLGEKISPKELYQGEGKTS